MDDDEDDEVNAAEFRSELRKMFIKNPANRDYRAADEDSSDMEARYDDIEEEEMYSARVAKREDAEQLKLIQIEEQRDAERKKKRRRD